MKLQNLKIYLYISIFTIFSITNIFSASSFFTNLDTIILAL